MKKILMAIVMAPLAFAEVGYAEVQARPTEAQPTEVRESSNIDIQQRRGRGGWRRGRGGWGHGRRCHGGYRRRCSSIRTPIGIVIRNCRRVWDPCARRGGWKMNDVNTEVFSMRAADLAEKYSVSFEAAEVVANAMDQAAQGNLIPAQELGLDGKATPAEAINSLSEEFNVEAAALENMIFDLSK